MTYRKGQTVTHQGRTTRVLGTYYRDGIVVIDLSNGQTVRPWELARVTSYTVRPS